MTEDEKGELRAKMRKLLREAAEFSIKIDDSAARFLYEACRGWNFAAGTEMEPPDFDAARDRYRELDLDEEPNEDQKL